MERIAVYGGSFDPVHHGHMEVARRLTDLFRLDEFWFMPAHTAPHKRDARVTPAFHRYAMLALATQDDRRLRVSTIELEAPEKPYTVETLTRLRERPRLGMARLFFVMGADSWAEITTWREWERLLTMTAHVVITRPGSELEVDHVTPEIGARVVDLRGAGAEEVARATEAGGERIYFTDAVVMDLSSTAVRRAAGAGRAEEMRASVPPSVAGYIEKYGLYRERNEKRTSDGQGKFQH